MLSHLAMTMSANSGKLRHWWAYPVCPATCASNATHTSCGIAAASPYDPSCSTRPAAHCCNLELVAQVVITVGLQRAVNRRNGVQHRIARARTGNAIAVLVILATMRTSAADGTVGTDALCNDWMDIVSNNPGLDHRSRFAENSIWHF